MKIRWPEAKFHGQSASDVQKSLAPQKMSEQRKKLFSFRKSKKHKILFWRRGVGTPFFSRGKSARRLFFLGGKEVDMAFFFRTVGARDVQNGP